MKEAIIDLLKSRIGFEINLFEVIFVGEAEDHTYYVYDNDAGEEWIFDTPEEAAEYFMQLRSDKELGCDYGN